jgi:hypothetical protein
MPGDISQTKSAVLMDGFMSGWVKRQYGPSGSCIASGFRVTDHHSSSSGRVWDTNGSISTYRGQREKCRQWTEGGLGEGREVTPVGEDDMTSRNSMEKNRDQWLEVI